MDVIGIPYVLVTNNGPPLSSNEFENWYHRKNIRIYHSPPWHPQSNGLAKRHVQDVKVLLKRISRDAIDPNWEEIAQRVETNIRFVSTQKLDNKTPVKLMFSYKPRAYYNSFIVSYYRIITKIT